MSKELSFVKLLVKSIVENKKMPKVQVEREISPILEIFLESFINELAKNHKIDNGTYKFIAPEFPLSTELENDQSFNIDFLMENDKTLYLVELKTDSSSFHHKQLTRYENVMKKTPEELFEFLKKLENKKYKNLLKYITNKGYNSFNKFNSIKLIYIAPKNLVIKNWGDENLKAIQKLQTTHNLITFEDLDEFNNIKHDFSEIWQNITPILKTLDENQIETK